MPADGKGLTESVSSGESDNIKAKVSELEQCKKATVDRELRLFEMKERLKLLESRLKNETSP